MPSLRPAATFTDMRRPGRRLPRHRGLIVTHEPQLFLRVTGLFPNIASSCSPYANPPTTTCTPTADSTVGSISTASYVTLPVRIAHRSVPALTRTLRQLHRDLPHELVLFPYPPVFTKSTRPAKTRSPVTRTCPGIVLPGTVLDYCASSSWFCNDAQDLIRKIFK